MEEMLKRMSSIEARLALLEAGRPPVVSGPVFPNYGKAKGQPLRGASLSDLNYYREGCLRALADPAKERFHAIEIKRMADIDDEIARQGGGESTEGAPF